VPAGRQDVPEAHAVGEKVLQRDGATSRHRVGQIGPHVPQYPSAGQLGQPAIHRFVEAQDAPLDQHQSAYGGDWFGQRGNAKDVVPLHRVALLERLGPHHVDPHLAPAGHQGNVPRHRAVLHMSSQAIMQSRQTLLAERFTAHDSRRSSHACTAPGHCTVAPVGQPRQYSFPSGSNLTVQRAPLPSWWATTVAQRVTRRAISTHGSLAAGA